MRAHGLPLFIAFFVVLGCSGGASGRDPTPDAGVAPPDGGTAKANVPGTYVETPLVEGSKREFIVHVPATVRGEVRAPVVFMFHGTGGDGQKFLNTSGWKEKGEAEAFITVFPSALVYCFHEDENLDGTIGANERVIDTKWAAGSLGDAAQRPLCTPTEVANLATDKRAAVDHPLRDDVAFVDHILDFLARTYSIDTKRIYASGFSNGGEMTAQLSVTRSARFAALASHAGRLTSTPALTTRPISFFMSFGDSDPNFVFFLGGQKPISLDASLQSNAGFSDKVVKPYTDALGLTRTATHETATVSGKKTSTFVYATSTRSAANRLRVMVVEGCDHQFPHGNNHPIMMPDLIWDFFKGEALP